jgi:hypothetical protein
MENARPSSLRGDIWARSDRALLARGEFTRSDGLPRNGFAVANLGSHIPCLFVLRRRPVLPYLKVAVVSAAKLFWMVWTLAAQSARF